MSLSRILITFPRSDVDEMDESSASLRRNEMPGQVRHDMCLLGSAQTYRSDQLLHKASPLGLR